MLSNCLSLLYSFDLIGETPQLLIFNSNRYKTIFSSIISILIVLFSIFLSLYSLNEYLRYDNPNLVYYKDNDSNTKRIISLKDTILMLHLLDSSPYSNPINNSIAYYEGSYSIMYNNGNYEEYILDIGKCQIGKNIDIKYKDYIENRHKYGRQIDSFYCINNRNISLFYDINSGYSYITLNVVIKNISNFAPEKIQSLIVAETDLLDHKNKESPIKQNFDHHYTPSFSSNEYTKIDYNFQYIEYESDDGLFFKHTNLLNGVTFSDISYLRTINEDYEINKTNMLRMGEIRLAINKASFDSYKRTYPRLQSLLADVMSVVSLLFEISRQITSFLFSKRMSKDIMKNILKSNKKIFLNSYSFNLINKNDGKIEKNNLENAKIESKEILDRNKSKTSILNNSISKKKDKSKLDMVDTAFNEINYLNIMKSFFCFKNRKTKFIELCHNIITKDMCIERILERFINLEKIYELNSTVENFKFLENNDYNEVINFINKSANERIKEKNKFNTDENNK